MGRASTMPGSQAPGFKLQNENDEWVNLSDSVKDNPLMLVFYPEDFSPVCTKQFCGYQKVYERFQDYDIQLLGISSNSPKEHLQFKQQYNLSFSLLSDPDQETTKNYGVTSFFMLGGASRAVFILSKGGLVLYRYIEPTVLTHRKPEELLKVLDTFKKEGRL